MKKYLSIFLFCFIFISTTKINIAQSPDFMMQGWYWNFPLSVGTNTYMENLGYLADSLGNAGFTYVWLPPLAKGTGGNYSVGYDIRDYYDLGEFGFARWGTKADYLFTMEKFNAAGIQAVADVIYNHRDGGDWEKNESIEGWIENMNYTKVDAGDQPFPSDRFRCILPIGGTTGNNAGTYYFKIHSASGHPNYFSKPYNLIMWTNKTPPDYITAITSESEPNGGGDCGESNNIYSLGKVKQASIDNSGCGTDEFALTLYDSQFFTDGDTLYIRMYNTGSAGLGDMSDHFIYGLWNAALGADIQYQIQYETATDFTNLPSGKGAMNAINFKPNGNPTQLSGDQDAMFFYYDLDHSISSTRIVLQEWTKWLWEENNIRGFRMDAVKHFPASFVGDMMDYLNDAGINPGMVVGESFDYSASYLKNWIDEVQSNMDVDTKENISVRIFDFALRNNLEQACDNSGFDVRNLFQSSIVDAASGSGFNVVTFVNNHDFRDGDQPLSNHPELAYAYIITNNKLGVPCVFYSDYFAPNNLQYQINGLMKVHTKYIYGATQVEYLNRFSSPYFTNYISGNDYRTLVYQTSNAESGREVIVAINFGTTTLKIDQTIKTTNIFAGDTLTDIFAISPYNVLTVQDDQQIYIEIPPQSFAVFVQGDLRDEIIDISTPVDIANFVTSDFSVYPNPTTDLLFFENENYFNESYQLKIVDGNGKTVLLKRMNPNENTINIKSLPAGVFFIELKSGNQLFQSSFIKI